MKIVAFLCFSVVVVLGFCGTMKLMYSKGKHSLTDVIGGSFFIHFIVVIFNVVRSIINNYG
jgi:hypothetical protein